MSFNTMSVRPFLFVASCLLFFISCNDDNEKKRVSILGRWELVVGFRNQKQTETLQGVFFEFGEDGKMTTNLPVGADTPTEFELNKNEILQKSPQPLTYSIKSVTDSTLVLTMEMRGMPFEMQLKKIVPASNDPLLQDSLAQPFDSLSR